MHFRKLYEDNNEVDNSTPAGEEIEDVLEQIVDDNGQLHLVPTGRQINNQELINAEANSCSMSSILREFARGNTEILNSQSVAYGDSRELPRSALEACDQLRGLEKKFNNLSAEVRDIFGNDFRNYLKFVDNGDTSKLNIPDPTSSDTQKSTKEVNSDE